MTPRHQFFSGEVEALTVSVPDGEITILAGHAHLAAPILVGKLSIKIDDEWKEAYCAEGFMEVGHNKVNLFVQSCEWPEDIDIERAYSVLRQAKDRLSHRKDEHEDRLAQIALEHSIARLKVAHQDIDVK